MDAKSEHKNRVKSILGLYILRILLLGPAHGNKIADVIRQRTGERITPNPNALYPLLRAMEERGYVRGDWDHPDKRCKRIYAITDEGKNFVPALEEKVAGRLTEMEEIIHVVRQDLFGGSEEQTK